MSLQKIKNKGFTLIELMIVVAIAGVIGSLALPSYFKQVQKSSRTEAKGEMIRIAQMQESFFVQNLSYANSLTQLGFGADTMPTEKLLYNLSIFSATPAGCDFSAAPPVACTTYQLSGFPNPAERQATDTDCLGFGFDNFSRKFAIGTTGEVNSTTWGGVTPIEMTKSRECWK